MKPQLIVEFDLGNGRMTDDLGKLYRHFPGLTANPGLPSTSVLLGPGYASDASVNV